MRNLTCSIIFIYSFHAFSNVCSNDPFGQRSLHSTSLSHQKTQTQGGLGTCYANALSVALGAEHGENISYQQLALIGSGSRSKNIDKLVKGSFGKSEMFVEGGDSCKTFNAMKRSGQKLCRSSDFPLENIARPKQQGETFEVVGRLYQRLYSLPADQRVKLARDLKNKSMEVSSLNIFCQNEDDFNIQTFELEKTLKGVCINNSVLIDRYNRLAENERGKEIFRNQTGRESPEEFISLRDQLGIKTTNEETSEIDCNYNSNFKKLLDGIKEDINLNAEKDFSYIEKSGEYLEKILPIVNKLKPLSDPLLGVKPEDLEQYIKNKIIDDMENARNAKMCRESNVVFELYSLLEDDRCHVGGFDQKEVEGAGFGMLGLLDLKMDLEEINNLLDSFNNYLSPQNYFMSTLGGNCQERGIDFNKRLKCIETKLPSGSTLKDSIDTLKEKSKRRLSDIYNKRVIDNNRPIVVSLCTGFMKNDENEQANFSGENGKSFKCDTTKKHGLHSMSIVGHRCINGTVEYEILNSWGAQCGSYNDYFKNNCDPETGRFFIPEEMLISNAFELEYLK